MGGVNKEREGMVSEASSRLDMKELRRKWLESFGLATQSSGFPLLLSPWILDGFAWFTRAVSQVVSPLRLFNRVTPWNTRLLSR